MNRKDLRTAEAQWRSTPNGGMRSTRATRRPPLTIGRMLEALRRWIG